MMPYSTISITIRYQKRTCAKVLTLAEQVKYRLSFKKNLKMLWFIVREKHDAP